MYAQSNQGKYLYISTLKSVSLFAEKKSFKLIHGKTASVIPTREKGTRKELKTNTLFIRSFNKKVKKKQTKQLPGNPFKTPCQFFPQMRHVACAWFYFWWATKFERWGRYELMWIRINRAIQFFLMVSFSLTLTHNLIHTEIQISLHIAELSFLRY